MGDTKKVPQATAQEPGILATILSEIAANGVISRIPV
jgi:hypothetical protein